VLPFVYSMDANAISKVLASNNFLSCPFILKNPFASRGKQNYLVESISSLNTIINQEKDVPFLAQRWVPNDGDFRLIVVNHKVRLAIKRTSTAGSHLNNTSQGGSAELVELGSLDSQMLNDAEQLSKLINRQVTGVDMIVDKQTGTPYFLEANNMPQLSTGAFVKEKSQVLLELFGS
jgi:glutathione synthase/RimK-type ligase-like ATP-grasp enzyme